jgi:predicted transposase YdaD
MKTDKLFYRIFLSQPDLIAELLPGVPPDCEFEYSAPVVKEIEVRLDGLLIPSSDDLSLPLVFLEAQMQTDVNFYGRYFAGIYLYLRQYKPNRPWKGLLILNRRSHDLGSEVSYSVAVGSSSAASVSGRFATIDGIKPEFGDVATVLFAGSRSQYGSSIDLG